MQTSSTESTHVSIDLLRNVLDSAPYAVVVAEAIRPYEGGSIADFRPIYYNRFALDWTGLRPEHYAQTLLTTNPALRPLGIFDRYVSVVEQGGEPITMERFLNNRWFMVRLSKLNDGFQSFFIDITEQKQIEQKERHQAETFDAVLKSMLHGMAVYSVLRDQDGQLADLRYEYVSQRLLQDTGLTADQIIGKTLLSLFPEVRKSRFWEAYEDVLRTGLPQEYEDHYHYDGFDNYVVCQAIMIDQNRIVSMYQVVNELKDARAAAQAQTELLQTVIDNTQAGLLLADAICQSTDSGDPGPVIDFRYRLTNQYNARFGGKKTEELNGQQISDVFPGWQNTELFRRMAQVFQTGQAETALLRYKAYGWDGWFDGTFTKVGDSVLYTYIDVTELKRSEEQLRHQENEKYLQNLMMQAPVAMAIFRGRDFIVELANEAHLQLWDRPLSAVIGRPVFDAVPEAAGQGYEALLMSVLNTGEPYRATEQPLELIRNGQPESLWVNLIYQPLFDTNGQTTGIMELIYDVTEQVRARQLIQDSETHFRQLANLVPALVWTSTPEGYSDFFNQRWSTYTGQAFDEAKGSGWTDVLHPDDLARTRHVWQASVQSGTYYSIEYRLRAADGSYRWFLAQGLPVRDDTGDVIRWFGTCTDIHDQKTLNERLEHLITERTDSLRQVNLDLERSNLNLLQFASVASHDLKEPLRKIQTFSKLLMESLGGRLNSQDQDYFDRIVRSAARMQTLVDDVLRLSKLSAPSDQFELVNLNEIIARIQDDLDITIQEKGAAISVDQLPVVEASSGQMHQLFQNLISNALKFAGTQQPQIFVEHPAFLSYWHTQFALPNNEYIAVRVRDNGIGFEQQYEEKIFGMFQRLHGRSQYEGTGIGLTIVKKIVENHQGVVFAEGHQGSGAAFTVLLPVRQSTNSF